MKHIVWVLALLPLLALTGWTACGIAPTSITKTFNPTTIQLGATSIVTLTLFNPNAADLTNIAFTDTLVNMSAVGGAVTGTCAGTTPNTLSAGATSLSFTGITVPTIGGSCTVIFSVTSSTVGTNPNQTSDVTGFVASTICQASGPPSNTATLTVQGADVYQVHYATNLTTLGDSLVNLTNTGANDPPGSPGTICANVYVFDPNEEELDCCSCQITPNALQSLSVIGLLSNNLTPEHPNSVVIKLLATGLTGTMCDPTSAGSAANPLVPGLRAWGTTLHQSSLSSGFTYGTETEFAQAGSTLSQGELNRLTGLCGFILANGSGNGQCSGCSVGGR